jgi:hypothetical protein
MALAVRPDSGLMLRLAIAHACHSVHSGRGIQSLVWVNV